MSLAHGLWGRCGRGRKWRQGQDLLMLCQKVSTLLLPLAGFLPEAGHSSLLHPTWMHHKAVTSNPVPAWDFQAAAKYEQCASPLCLQWMLVPDPQAGFSKCSKCSTETDHDSSGRLLFWCLRRSAHCCSHLPGRCLTILKLSTVSAQCKARQQQQTKDSVRISK